MTTREFNFDGLVGPTHNHSGLSFGNIASAKNASLVANPRAAALQGLAKMQALAQRGFAQAILPPHRRPDFGLLRAIGITGCDADMIATAYRAAPLLLASAYSAAPMWTANAATVSPASDTADAKTHFTVANLTSKLHRSQEYQQTYRTLRAIFSDDNYFQVHPALPACAALADEGAANHGRLSGNADTPGVEFFVYGCSDFHPAQPRPSRFPARQTLEAGQAIARLHGLAPQRTVFIRQNPEAIDQGVFHNDVIAVANESVLFYHEQAFADEALAISSLASATASLGEPLQPIRVNRSAIPIQDAISTYLFNSQLLSRPNGGMTLVIPKECEENSIVAAYLQQLLAEKGPIDELLSFDLRQSMRNGGGPACLRLRVVLTDAEASAMHQGVILTDSLHTQLVAWITQHYRDRLAPSDLADPDLAIEVNTALDSLAKIIELPNLYQCD
jgi:succinylarginine dihydrolase